VDLGQEALPGGLSVWVEVREDALLPGWAMHGELPLAKLGRFLSRYVDGEAALRTAAEHGLHAAIEVRQVVGAARAPVFLSLPVPSGVDVAATAGAMHAALSLPGAPPAGLDVLCAGGGDAAVWLGLIPKGVCAFGVEVEGVAPARIQTLISRGEGADAAALATFERALGDDPPVSAALWEDPYGQGVRLCYSFPRLSIA